MSNDARYSVENLSLRQILKIAYRAQSNAQITGGSGAILAQSRSTRSKTAKEESWRVIGRLAATECYLVPNLFRRYDSTVAVSSAVRMRL
jgi:hypothetical protein